MITKKLMFRNRGDTSPRSLLVSICSYPAITYLNIQNNVYHIITFSE